MTQRPSAMSRAAFVARYGPLFEHSPWIAGEVYDHGLDARHDTLDGLDAAFRSVLAKAERPALERLLRAHPVLACGRRELTGASQSEQAGAGLDACSATEFEEFRALNARYLKRFGFPFIMAVRGHDRGQILECFRTRIEGSLEDEFRTALEQVALIGRNRLEELWDE